MGGPGAGTTYRLTPGRYRVGGPRSRVPLGPFTEGAWLDLLVRSDRTVLVEGSGQSEPSAPVQRADAGGSRTPEDPVEWSDGAQRAVGSYLLEVAATVPGTAPLTRAPDELTWDFNRPPRFVPDPVGGRFRLPTA